MSAVSVGQQGGQVENCWTTRVQEEKASPTLVLAVVSWAWFQVATVDGMTYERRAIEEWLTYHDTAPMTGETLPSKQLVPNDALRGQIRRHIAFAWCRTLPP